MGWEYKFSSMDEGRLYVELGQGVLMDGGRSRRSSLRRNDWSSALSVPSLDERQQMNTI